MIITDNTDTVIFDANVGKLKTSAKYTETVNQCNLILFIGLLKGLVTKYYYFLSKFIYSFVLAEFSCSIQAKVKAIGC